MMWSPVDEWCQVCVSVSPLFVTLDIISMKKNDKTFHFVPCSLSHIKFIILSYSCEQQQLSVAGGNEHGLNWILCHNPLCSICNNEYINLVPAGMRFRGCVRLRPLGSMTWPWRRDWRADNGIHTITYNIIIQPQQNIDFILTYCLRKQHWLLWVAWTDILRETLVAQWTHICNITW